MAKKKLTAKLKAKIKSDYRTLHKSDFEGEALTYLNRVRGAAKARKIKADTTIEVDGFKIPRNSHTYDVLTASAADLGITPAQLVKKHPEVVNQFIAKGGRFDFNREADYLKDDIKKASGKVYNKGKVIKKDYARYLITRFKNKAVSTGLIYNFINVEHYYDGHGNLHLNLPTPSEYKGLEGVDFIEFLEDGFPDIEFNFNK